MSHHSTTIPLSVIDPTDDGDGEIAIAFDWTPSVAPNGLTGPADDYDPGAGEEFYLVGVTAGAVDFPRFMYAAVEEKIITYLEENWERPDYAAEKADYLYDQYRDRMMERHDD